MSLHLGVFDREWRAIHPLLVVHQGHQQALAGLRQNRLQVGGVALAHFRRQGDQRSAVIESPALGNLVTAQGEKVAAQNPQRARLVDPECPVLRHLRLYIALSEEILHRALGQLHTDHGMPLLHQPDQVETLATQRHQHRRTFRQPERGPVTTQVAVDLFLMKTDLIARPALLPECRVHTHSPHLNWK
ncbi:hypothetical protein N619_06075 [Ectopseudomonas oleovorans]|nr:hypothetical protein N619_06075 [Pseudomonas oleovorans]